MAHTLTASTTPHAPFAQMALPAACTLRAHRASRLVFTLGAVLIALALCAGASSAWAAEGGAQKSSPSTVTTAPASTKANGASNTGAFLTDKAVYRISSALAGKDKLVLDVSGASTKVGANVHLWENNGTFAQYWRAEHQGGGVYRFVSYTGGHLLGAAQAKQEGNARTQDTGNVDWRVSKNADGTFQLIPANATNLRLDVAGAGKRNGTNIWLYGKNGTKAQSFHFVKQTGLTEAFKAGKAVAPGTYEIALAGNTKLRLDIEGSSRAQCANVQLANDSSALSQKFQVGYLGNGIYEIKGLNSGKALDVANGSKQAGANVWQYSPNRTQAQLWYFQKAGSGYQIKSVGSALALDTKGSKSAAGANVQMAKSSSAASQKYTFVKTQLVENGTYVISSAACLPMVLDVAGAGKSNGSNLNIYRSNGTAAQKFTIRHIGGGIYTIVNVNSQKAIDVAGASKASGANVWTWESNNTDAQKWRIEVGPYGLMFKSVASGKYLDVSGARTISGTNVQQWDGNKSKAQCWNLYGANWKFYPNGTNLNDLKVILKAEEYEGWEYQWGGRSPSQSFDCAGIVMYCSNAVWGTDFDLIYTNADRLYGMCQKISASEAKVGDLVFYRGTYGSDINYISHVVFYTGRNMTYGAGDPIGYYAIDSVRNKNKEKAKYMFARIRH